MDVRNLAVLDAYEFTPRVYADDRGVFAAPYQQSAFVNAVGWNLRVAQVNHSVSKKGTIRGIHFAEVPPGQAKFVHCPRGSLLDVVVDVRVGSPTYGGWDTVLLDSGPFRAVYIAEGLAHAFMALEDDTAMVYLCSTGYDPDVEHGITPLDSSLGLPWPDLDPILSSKDASAPTLAEAKRGGQLPTYDNCVKQYTSRQFDS